MFSNQGSDQGCGKWLTTKNTRRIAHSLQQKNTRGNKKGRKKKPVVQGDHLPGVVISSTPMPPSLVEMLSRVKQAKVERFFKPVGSKDDENKRSKREESVDGGGLGKDVLGSFTTPILKRQHKTTTDQDLQLWGDDDITSNETQFQNETDKLSISGVLPIEVSKPCSSVNNDLLAQDFSHPNTATNQHDPWISSSPDDSIKSPVSKRFRSMADDSPACPPSPFSSSINNDDDEKDSDSFQYTQWVNEQKRKSKELQSDSAASSQKHAKLEKHSGRCLATSSNSTDWNKKYSQEISDETFSDTESQFRFTQWALEQKAKCKRLRDDLDNKILSDPKEKTESLPKSPTHLHSDLDWAESNFQYTEWVREQKTRSKEIQYSLGSNKVPQSCNGKMTEILNENYECIPESEVFEEAEPGCEYGWQYGRKGSLEGNSENLGKADHQNSSNVNPLSRQAFKSVSNEVMCSNGTSLKTERKHLKELFHKETKEEENNMTGPSQDSEDFQYTEWTRNERQICKQIQGKPEVPSIQDDFWEIPTEKNEVRSGNEKLVLASDTDQESDTEFF